MVHVEVADLQVSLVLHVAGRIDRGFAFHSPPAFTSYEVRSVLCSVSLYPSVESDTTGNIDSCWNICCREEVQILCLGMQLHIGLQLVHVVQVGCRSVS